MHGHVTRATRLDNSFEKEPEADISVGTMFR